PLLVAQSHVAQQPGEQRAVDRAIAIGFFRLYRGFRPIERLLELLVHVAPLAHAWVRQEILAAQPLQPGLVLQLPQLEEREEIRLLVGKARVTLVGRLGAFRRPLSRVLHRERRGDDAYLRETTLVACGDQ